MEVEQYVTVGEDPEDGQKDENPSDENTNINWPAVDFAEIGRASCRERVWHSV